MRQSGRRRNPSFRAWHSQRSKVVYISRVIPCLTYRLPQLRVAPTHLQLQQSALSIWKPPSPPHKYLPELRPYEFSGPRLPNRLTLWKNMHVRITGTLGKMEKDGFVCPVPFKGYEAYIKEVNEHWQEDPNEPKDPQDREEYRRNLPRPQEASLFHQQGYFCTSGCPACLPQSLSVNVELSAQAGGLVRNVDIAYIQPFE